MATSGSAECRRVRVSSASGRSLAKRERRSKIDACFAPRRSVGAPDAMRLAAAWPDASRRRRGGCPRGAQRPRPSRPGRPRPASAAASTTAPGTMTSARPGSSPGSPGALGDRQRGEAVGEPRDGGRGQSVPVHARRLVRRGDRDRARPASSGVPAVATSRRRSARPDPTPRLVAEARVHVRAARGQLARLRPDHCTKKRSTSWTTPRARLTAASTRDRPRRPAPRCCRRRCRGARTCRARRRDPTRRRGASGSASSSPLTTRGRMPGSARRRARNSLPSRAWRTAAVATSRTSRAPRARARSRIAADRGQRPLGGGRRERAARRRPSPRRVTAWSAHSGTSPAAGSASATRMRTVLVPRSIAREGPRHLRTGRGALEQRGDGGPERVEADGLLDDRVDAVRLEGLRVHPAGPAGDQDHRDAGLRPLGRAGDLEAGAAAAARGPSRRGRPARGRAARRRRRRRPRPARDSPRARGPGPGSPAPARSSSTTQDPALGRGSGLARPGRPSGSRGGRQAKAHRRPLPRRALDLELAPCREAMARTTARPTPRRPALSS